MSRIAEQMESQLLSPRLSRRGAIGAMGGLVALAATGTRAARQPETLPPIARKARNVIFMVADGMSVGTLTLAELYSKKKLDRQSHWVKLLGQKGVRRCQQTTHSADGPVTDSAAAASAWGSGIKFLNGAINISPEGQQTVPILVQAMQGGKKTGLVTTTRVTHATPAGFIANAPKRDLEADIANDIAARGVDVVMGGGAKHFTDEMLSKFATVVRDAAGLGGINAAKAAGGKTIGLFARQHMPFLIDRDAKVPSLPAMAKTALSILSRAADGFVLQIEGGRVDHAAHSSDAYCLVREMVEFDETIAAVLEFVNGRDDTLLVITTDHGNANPGLTLYGKRGADAFDQLCKASKSMEWIDGKLPSKVPVEDRIKALPDLIEQGMGVKLGSEEMKFLGGAFRNERVTPFAAANVWSFVLGSILADHFGVGFVSPNHTSDAVELLAMGPGSEAVPAWVDNTQMHEVMVKALGLGEAKLLPGMEKIVAPQAPKTDD